MNERGQESRRTMGGGVDIGEHRVGSTNTGVTRKGVKHSGLGGGG